MADWGIQAWNGQALETMSPSRRAGRLFTDGFSVPPNAPAGSFTVTLPPGDPIFIVLQSSAEFYDRANVTLNGSTFSWDQVGSGFTVRYGVR